MATGDLLDDNPQIETRGLLMGKGTALELAGPVEGLGVLPSRGIRTNRPRQHGTRPIRQYAPERPIRWRLNLLADDVAEGWDLIKSVGEAWAPLESASNVELALDLGAGEQWLLYGQPGRTDTDLKWLYAAPPTPVVAVEWVATDPRIYSLTPLASFTGLGATTGGLALPHGFPHGFGSASSGSINTAHDGNAPTPWTATIIGTGSGLTNPSLELGSTGERLELILALASGEYVELNSRDRTVLLAGTADRSNTINRPTADSWFSIPPEADTVSFGGTGSGVVVLNYRSAWHL